MSKKSNKQARKLKKREAEIEKLRSRLKDANKSTAKWKAKAKRFEAKATKRSNEVKRLREDQPPSPSTAPNTTTQADPPSAAALPDESWRVTRLRAEARKAAVPGYSRMTKAALLDALTPPTGP